MTSEGHDEALVAALDAMGKAASEFRNMIPGLTLRQLELIAMSCPWNGTAARVLLDLDTWAVAAVATVRHGEYYADGIAG